MSRPLVQIKHLNAHYLVGGKSFPVIKNISFNIMEGEIVGLVGESGCGKTTVGKLLLGLTPPTSGEILFEDQNITTLSPPERIELRRHCQMIFQDPYGSINPRMTITEIIKEPLHIFHIGSAQEKNDRVVELLYLVGLDESYLTRYPHELSGGQRQRIVIARALALKPRFLICDEPLAALDVSIQAQIINLFKELQQKLGLTILFISHDLAVVKYLANRTLVMYAGEIIETADSDDLYSCPLHPYTSALLSSIPIPNPELERKRARIVVKGEPPKINEKIEGCPFASRCPKRLDHCLHVHPSTTEANPGHFVSCHLYTQQQQRVKENELEFSDF